MKLSVCLEKEDKEQAEERAFKYSTPHSLTVEEHAKYRFADVGLFSQVAHPFMVALL